MLHCWPDYPWDHGETTAATPATYTRETIMCMRIDVVFLCFCLVDDLRAEDVLLSYKAQIRI